MNDKISKVIKKYDGWLIIWESGSFTRGLSKREVIDNFKGELD